MKKFLLIFVFLVEGVLVAGAINGKNGDLKAIRGLVHRLLPAYEKSFDFKLIKASEDVFRLESRGDKILVSGNNANSMAVGLNHYLKYYCRVEVGWLSHDSIAMPRILPKVGKPKIVKARVKDRFFLNYCTFGYTMPWWDWQEWEHFIDWMALNGVNLPLAITGQESIWYKVWTELGLTDAEVRDYFTGPSHLPWHRMLNIDSWGSPLPKSWLDGQLKLQQQITAREREFNMRPVLPAFAGHVPHALLRLFPKAHITRLEAWSGYPDRYACSFLDPMDSLFLEVQKKFISVEEEMYGTDHVYGIDLFNELTPPSYEPSYLSRVSRQVYESLRSADPDAVWLQMTWLFWNERKDWTNDRIKPYITSYPKDKSLLLDYYCERQEIWQRTDKYFGVPYIWCYLGNFGGNTMLVGDFNEVNKRLENTFQNGGDNFTGIGSTLEGFDCNPYIYEYVFEKAWDFGLHKDVKRWTEALADQRVGKIDDNAREAWRLLVDSIYVAPSVPGQCPLINIRPTFGKYRTYYANPRIKYDNRNLLKIVDLLLKVKSGTAAYKFDVANITRQLLSNYFLTVFKQYEEAYGKRDRKAMNRLQAEMMSLIDDVDRMVGTQTFFLTGKWIADARKWGGDSLREARYYEQNARNLITTWSDKDQLLNDYASRTWAGLTKTFYGKRWSLFFEAVNEALDEGKAFDEDRFSVYRDKVTTYERYWWQACLGRFSERPVGDSRQVAAELVSKYREHVLHGPLSH